MLPIMLGDRRTESLEIHLEQFKAINQTSQQSLQVRSSLFNCQALFITNRIYVGAHKGL
jgi:hypothetical protein